MIYSRVSWFFLPISDEMVADETQRHPPQTLLGPLEGS